jgi:1,4-alpha-glucan branching enzyme
MDPANPNNRYDKKTGLSLSVISVPAKETVYNPLKGPPGSLSFVFKGPVGETVSVAGDFNAWDPFMYELKEGPPGNYSLNIPLPPGKYQYVFFFFYQRYLDPYNSKRTYSKDGKIASEIVIQ